MAVRVDFHEVHERWLYSHIQRRSGEGRRRLEEDERYAERLFAETIWYPVIPNLTFLHPEYELRDFNGKLRFIDYAWLREWVKLAIEIDPYGTHAANISKWQHDDNMMRHNHLLLDGWFILRFTLNQIKHHPRECQRVLQQFFGMYVTMGVTESLSDSSADTIVEREVVRVAQRLGRAMYTTDVMKHLKITEWQARKIVARLVAKGVLVPCGDGKQRVRGYELHANLRR